MKSANPLLKDPDVSMNDQQTDPTLDFLEQQFPSSQLMIEMKDLFSVNPVTSHNQDLAPSSVESRGNSRPLESSQSTPVPVPIERETQPSDLLPLTDSSNLPRLNIQRVDVLLEEVKAAVTILDSQWNLFLRARSNNNAQLMRAALMQAYTNQLVLLQLVSQEAMMRLSHQWNAKDELDKLEAKMLSQLQNSNMVIDQDLATQTTPNTQRSLLDVSTKRNASFEPPSYYFTPAGKLAAIRTRNGQPLPSCFPERDLSDPSSPSRVPLQYPSPREPVSGTKRAQSANWIPLSERERVSQTEQPPLPGKQSEPRQREEPSTEPRFDLQHDGDREFFRPGRKSSQRDAAKRPWSTFPQTGQGQQPDPSQQPSPSIASRLHPKEFEVSPNPSEVEKIFANIDHEFIAEAPFLIEDRLKDLFANFLEDLSGTMDAFPGTLLEACVSRLNATVSSSMLEVIRANIIPSLVHKIMLHVSEFSPPAPNTLNVNIPDSLTDKIDGLQDIILGMHSVNDDKIEKLSRSFHHMEDQLREQVLDLKQKLLDSQKREEDIIDQVRRRLGDLSSLSASIKERVDKSALENQKPSEYSQPLRYNNPMMNEQSPSNSGARKAFHYRTVPPKIPSEENTGTHPPPNNNPQWLTEFPFINQDHVDVEMRKELWKSIPKTSEWEKFSGELPYKHELWLKNIDVFVQDYCMLDHMIISRLTALFTDTAKNWYIGIRDSHENRSWAWWKNTIRNKFGTHNWKWKMQQ
ncbi:hypothetical protein PCASD_06325 [Puccinia coronata f. sp. avenae]|uniref:Uncharacterized protein n=1 Tax=Puccinia coronata f. sp. avenae TaxID=200324 RepID=A0A2N5V8X9_9BASI|nr:hypothetical protein PCASD_06325 [Puccinia coronata f. sp. avenae]